VRSDGKKKLKFGEILPPNPTEDDMSVEYRSKETRKGLSEGMFDEERRYLIHDHKDNEVF